MRSPSASTSSSASVRGRREATDSAGAGIRWKPHLARIDRRRDIGEQCVRCMTTYNNRSASIAVAQPRNTRVRREKLSTFCWRPAALFVDEPAVQPPAAHRCCRRPGPPVAAALEAPVQHAAAVGHRRSRQRRRRRGAAARAARGCAGGAHAARRRERGGAPGRRVHRAAVAADPRGQHDGRGAPVRGGAQARREAHRVRQLQPRHRLLPAGRSDRPARSGAARRLLRPEQGLGRERVALLLRPLRHRERLPAHRLVVSRAEGPPHARHLAQLRRPRSPRHRLPDHAGARATPSSTACRTTPTCGGTTPRRATSAIGRRTAPRRSAPRCEAKQPTIDLDDPVSIHQGGAFVRIGPFE